MRKTGPVTQRIFFIVQKRYHSSKNHWCDVLSFLDNKKKCIGRHPFFSLFLCIFYTGQ